MSAEDIIENNIKDLVETIDVNNMGETDPVWTV